MIRRMNSSNSGTVNAVSPWLGLQIQQCLDLTATQDNRGVQALCPNTLAFNAAQRQDPVGRVQAHELELSLRKQLPDRRPEAVVLANRVVATGTAHAVAESLAPELSRLPQRCLRSDRASVYVQSSQPLEQALLDETRLGVRELASGESCDGALRFSQGAGRSGQPVS